MADKTGFLEGKKAILEYIGCSDYRFQYLISCGLPARFDGVWMAHIENIEAFLKRITAIQEKNYRDEE